MFRGLLSGTRNLRKICETVKLSRTAGGEDNSENPQSLS